LTAFYTKHALYFAFKQGFKEGTPIFDKFVNEYVDNGTALSMFIKNHNPDLGDFTFY